MGQFSFTHILLVMMIVLLFFGPSKLPQLGKSLGQALRGFKEGMNDLHQEPSNTAANQGPKQQLSPSAANRAETLAQPEATVEKNTIV